MREGQILTILKENDYLKINHLAKKLVFPLEQSVTICKVYQNYNKDSRLNDLLN